MAIFRLFSRFAPALLIVLALPAQAVVRDVYSFDTDDKQQRYQTMTAELRCPKCQNQNIADSNSPISEDMRDEVYRMMTNGASDVEIMDSLVGRFGEFIRYKPLVEKRTLLLWATPVISVLGGFLIVGGIVLRSRRNNQVDSELSAEERARVEKIMDGHNGKSDSQA
ncbi:cytochrome c-type biogenesis protein CcmH [Marinobacter sp. M3C]|jgi:cytochrome c-type biogenesis protein CcmH|uniref:cytochrome c-type biogenesis protein n=1 Tax=unclassified Marinobacter TaxID=83889 RepID=UPI00201014D8|nr:MULTISPECIES: cytochrome c-type biogenesis protein [unclassified Marinobacter]MCL1489119.1 cytochrome c-type biogenesis protein CcmH [Marinobacter sp.]UQG57253.1 cytochrome c-type biogenesis protein CcmH [Marinobacter sp. M4C]UQG61564.1 cytochrome c-type biogenesis protein CcmH [Marinobacter sp. M3C]UQG66057.1 cytochrome c-type biogenesis protein CcmH [Marinobacter sp. M2C]UQG70337.1 cytochrome c-type biogenesis protein CcmH [Marinobacter sp. M1C]